jgi:hypothetical protein
METYRCDTMSEGEVDKLLAVAIVAVLIEESAGLSIRPSKGRDGGTKWSIDHRRVSVGRRSILKTKSGRSANR